MAATDPAVQHAPGPLTPSGRAFLLGVVVIAILSLALVWMAQAGGA